LISIIAGLILAEEKVKKLLLVTLALMILQIVPVATGCGLPQVAFGTNVNSGPAPLSVEFTNLTPKIKPDSTIVFDWDFGDGQKQTAAKFTDAVSHQYTKVGTYTITLTEYKSDKPDKSQVITQTVTVLHGSLAKVNVIPEKAELNIGQSQTFTSDAFDAYGNPIPEASYNWKSDAAGIISGTGAFTAGNKAGIFKQGVIATGAADSKSIDGSASVTIKPEPLDSAVLETLQITASESKQLIAIAKDKYGNQIDSLQATWTVSNTKAGTITADGLFTASRRAVRYDAAITVTVKQGDKTSEAKGNVVIVPGEMTQVGMYPDKIDLGMEMTQQFVAIGADKYGNKITGVTFSWSALSAAGIINQSGLFTAGDIPANYTGAVTVTAKTANTELTKQATVNIEKDKVLFLSNRDDETEDVYKYYMMNVDGTEIQKYDIASQGILESRIECSSDGRRIIYVDLVTGQDSYSSYMYVTNTEGTWLSLLNSDTAAFEPAISTDGNKVAYQSWKTGNADIYVMEIDGGNVVNLTDTEAYDDYPDWSPDGSKIVFISQRDTGNLGISKIYTVNPDGSGIKQLTTGITDDSLPQWSPDGKEILFQSNLQNMNYWSLYIMNADGSNIRTVYAPANSNASIPRWSPDGSRIIFNSDMNGNEFDIYTIDPDGQNLTRVTDSTARDVSPNWLYPKRGVQVDASSPVVEEDFEETAMSAQDISNMAKDAVVRIEITTNSGTSHGSGIVIKSSGLILTANHVITDSGEITKITVYLNDGTTYTGSVAAKDSIHDLALVKIDASNLTTLEIGNLNGVQAGQQVVVLGYPLLNKNVSVTSGLVSTLEYDDGLNTTWLQTDSAINGGNSGGPLLDMNGRVIGIVTAKLFGIGIEGIGYAISANTIHLYLGEMLTDAGLTL